MANQRTETFRVTATRTKNVIDKEQFIHTKLETGKRGQKNRADWEKCIKEMKACIGL